MINKNLFKSVIKNLALKLGILIELTSNNSDLILFIKRFKENYKSVNLIRMGDKSDGGYLVPNILNNIDYCFSPGVGDKSTFEYDLTQKYNIKVFLADGSVNAPKLNHKNFFL